MAELAEVAIEKALLTAVIGFCASPAIPLALPNVSFTPPTAAPGVFWMRATFLPAESFALGLGNSAVTTIQHYGLLQVDVFYNQGAGEYPAGRMASNLIAYFKRGNKFTLDGFVAEIWKIPSRGRAVKDDPWIMIPVTIPYIAFAPSPA